MDFVLSHIPAIVFWVVGAVAVASSLLVVSMRNPVHSALFLLVTFLCVAMIFFIMGAEFVGAVQVLVYAGGIMVLFLFVVMLINVRTLQTEAMLSRYWAGGLAMGLGLFLIFGSLVRTGAYHAPVLQPENLRSVTDVVTTPSATDSTQMVRTEVKRTDANSEAVGMALYRDYLVPFEIASIFLLVAMIGAIVIGKRELSAEEEETQPEYVMKRVRDEERVKEAMGA
jgi:NADH-quinone oxidoreductase subunit J